MDHVFVSQLSSFVGIIKDTLKLFPSNSKFLLTVAILTSSINSILFLLNVFSIQSSIRELIATQSFVPLTSPGIPEFTSILFLSIIEDNRILFGVKWIFVMIQFISYAFVTTTIILATSALIVDQKAMPMEELLLKATKALKRVILIPIFLLVNTLSYDISVLHFFIAAGFTAYLSVGWGLSVEISVIEEKSGIEALRKASFKLDGFMINLVFMIVSYGLFRGSRFLILHHGENNFMGILILIGLVVVNFISLAKMFWLMTFTVLYYKCKESSEHFKVPAEPFIIAEDVLSK